MNSSQTYSIIWSRNKYDGFKQFDRDKLLKQIVRPKSTNRTIRNIIVEALEDTDTSFTATASKLSFEASDFEHLKRMSLQRSLNMRKLAQLRRDASIHKYEEEERQRNQKHKSKANRYILERIQKLREDK